LDADPDGKRNVTAVGSDSNHHFLGRHISLPRSIISSTAERASDRYAVLLPNSLV